MAVQVAILLFGLILLTAGAEILVRGGASLAIRLGITPLVVGLTVVAYGTSTPEMVVSIGGALRGYGDIAVGNVVGSNIFNIGAILGLAAIITPMNIKLGLLKLDVPLMIAISLLAAWLTLFAVIPRLGGVALIIVLVSYTTLIIILARKQAAPDITREFEEGLPRPSISAWHDILFIVVGLGVLFSGSNFFIKSAMIIARTFGVSEAVIALTIVAAGTSMPELATSIIAAIRGQADIAVGTIIGSNIFNILGILGLAATLKPLSAPGISPADLLVMVAFSVALLPLLWTEQKLQRWEGALLFGGYLCYLWFLWPKN